MRPALASPALLFALNACSPAPEELAPVEEAKEAPSTPPRPTTPPPGGTVGTAPPSLSTLVEGGATVSLTLTLEGASTATVDFVVDGPDGGRILAQETVRGPTATLSIPASRAEPVWLSAAADVMGDGPDPSDPRATPKEPLQLDGTPKTVTLVFGPGEPPPDFGPFKHMQGQSPAPAAPVGPPTGVPAPVLPGAPAAPPDGASAPTPPAP